MTNQNLNQLKSVMNTVRSASNPQAMLAQLAQSNPQIKQVMDMVNRYGDPKTAFYKEAERRGVDPDDILGLLK